MKTFTVSLLLSALTLTAQAGTSLGICVIHEGRTHLGVMAVAMEATPEVAYLEKKGTVSVEAEGYKCQGEFVVTDSIGPMSLVEVTLINPAGATATAVASVPALAEGLNVGARVGASGPICSCQIDL